MDKNDQKRRILVCGGGNGAHCLATLATLQENVEVNVLTLFADEADRWNKSLDKDEITLSIVYTDGRTEDRKSKPRMISKDTSKAMEGVSVIFLTVPAFAHAQYITEMTPYIRDNTLIVGLPSQAGFEFQCRNILGERAKYCVIASFESLPWACRILEFGRHARILGIKETLGGVILEGSKSSLPFDPVSFIQGVLGEKPVLKLTQNYIAVNLMAKSFVHPPIMYCKWKNFNGTPLKEKPLFYQGVDKEQADLLSKVSDEIVKTAKEIQSQRHGVDMSAVIHIFDYFKAYYHDQITDHSSLMTSMQTNKAFDGLLHPMTSLDDGTFLPDFSYRYMTEDIPYGLVVTKGIAQIANVKTPAIDEIITWAQGKLEKEYLIGSELKGKDVKTTRAPQSYGYSTLDHLFNV